MQEAINGLVASISAYIDTYQGINLTKEQSNCVFEIREVIVDSLKKNTSDLSPQKAEKIKKKLDDSFMKVINVFTQSGISTPEIYEAYKQLHGDNPMKKKEAKTSISKKLAAIDKKKKKLKHSKKSKEDTASLEELFNPSSKEKIEMAGALIDHGLPGDMGKAPILMHFLQLMAKRLDKVIKDQGIQNNAQINALEIILSQEEDIKTLKKEIKRLKKGK